MALDNDTRGWILTGISGLACFIGALFICIDLVIRLLPGRRNYRLQDSNGFLSCSLGLSAGVMLFSALYKLLPSSKSSLHKGGYSKKQAAWILIGCFLAGVWGIQVLSAIMHRLLPSHVVDCEHTHEDDIEDGKSHMSHKSHAKSQTNGHPMMETTPLLSRPSDLDDPLSRQASVPDLALRNTNDQPVPVRPSFSSRMSRTMTRTVTLLSGEKAHCVVDGTCKGYSDPCGLDCFKNALSRAGSKGPSRLPSLAPRPGLRHSATTSYRPVLNLDLFTDPQHGSEQAQKASNVHEPAPPGSALQSPSVHNSRRESHVSSHHHADDHGGDGPHHHHVPENAFVSLSFQTSVAIVLHKLPEGFITYASNHANPELGFNVFMALAIHNLTEGFCLALPIFLATNSRLKALAYSFVLGGFSQPLGAAIVAIWLKVAEGGKHGYKPSDGVYGCLFAITSGILANVAVSLLSQSFELSHRKGLCVFFVFVGMGILGVSLALTA